MLPGCPKSCFYTKGILFYTKPDFGVVIKMQYVALYNINRVWYK